MADVPVGQVSAPAASPPAKQPPGAARAAKLASVSAGLAKLSAEQVSPAADVTEAAASVAKQPPAVVEKPAEEAKADEKPVESKTDDKPKVETKTETDDDTPDPKTAKALAAIDKQAKKFRDEQAKARADFEMERAEFARERAERQKDFSSIDDIRKLAKLDPIAALAKLGIDSEDDWERVGRGAFPLTKMGKADPRARDVAAQTQHKSEIASEIAELKKQNAELLEMFQSTQKKAEAQSYVDQWQSEAVKAIPADRKTLVGNQFAKSPSKTKQMLLEIGQQLESDNDGETPSHAEVFAEAEKRLRAELVDLGVDVDALLKPAAAAPEQPKTPSKTLDITSNTGTKPINGIKSRAERLAAVSADLKKFDAEA